MEKTTHEGKPCSPEQIEQAKKQFTVDEIKRSLDALKQPGQPAGSELKDFISDLERLVQEA